MCSEFMPRPRSVRYLECSAALRCRVDTTRFANRRARRRHSCPTGRSVAQRVNSGAAAVQQRPHQRRRARHEAGGRRWNRTRSGNRERRGCDGGVNRCRFRGRGSRRVVFMIVCRGLSPVDNMEVQIRNARIETTRRISHFFRNLDCKNPRPILIFV